MTRNTKGGVWPTCGKGAGQDSDPMKPNVRHFRTWSREGWDEEVKKIVLWATAYDEHSALDRKLRD